MPTPNILAIILAAVLGPLIPGIVSAQQTSEPYIDLDVPLREGDLQISGRADGTKQVIARVYSGWRAVSPTGQRSATETENLQQSQRYQNEGQFREAQTLQCISDDPVATAGPVPVEKGAFTLTFQRRLNGGECVVVQNAEINPRKFDPTSVSEIVRSVLLEIGRLRGYFSVGGAVSRYRGAFSQTDTFIGLTQDALLGGEIVEKYTCVPLDGTLKENLRRCPQGGSPVLATGPLSMRGFRYQFNASIDGGVGFRLATTGNTGTAQVAAANTQPFQRPDQLVYGANRPGHLQFGFHAPLSWRGMDWRSDGRLYSFFVGPLYKWGVETLESPVVVSRTVAIDMAKPPTDTARYSLVSEDLRTGALPYWGAGVRFGAYQYELIGRDLRQRQISNDPVAYVDVAWGRASAFRTYATERALNADGTAETATISSQVRRRLSVEGRLKLPSLPALVGFDINVRGNTDAEPNEFRFIVAFRIDAQRALGRIFADDALKQ